MTQFMYHACGSAEEIENLSDTAHSFIHSFFFSNHFILIKTTVDLESILETLGEGQEYTLDGTPAY